MGADEVDPCDILSNPAIVETPDELIFAINCANANATSDTITISGTISLSATDNDTDGNNGLPSITSEIIINGDGNIIERSTSAGADFRLFHVNSTGDLTLNDVTLQNGSISSGNHDGGAVYIHTNGSFDHQRLHFAKQQRQ